MGNDSIFVYVAICHYDFGDIAEMKKLDEVITVLDGCFLKSRKEWCIENCPYLQNDEQMCRRDVLNDALHYLKEYQAILPLVPSLINTAIEVQRIRQGKTIG